jgi:hypothetical protein
MIEVREEIEEIVNSFKSSGSISLWIDNTGSYTVGTSDIGNLQAGFKVVLTYADTSLNRDVILTSIDSNNNTFTFNGTGIAQANGWEMALYFEVGHRIELNEKYTNKAKSINKYVHEYPLFWLYTDFERSISDVDQAEFNTVLQGAIVDFTQKELYEEQRVTNKFVPILYPYLELFHKALNTLPYYSKFVTPYGTSKEIDILTTDRPLFGSSDDNAHVLSQTTDAIEWQIEVIWKKQGSVCTGY